MNINNATYTIPTLPLNVEIEDKKILKQLAISSRLLGELKGAAEKIPNKRILIQALTLMEAKDSSEVENIVTTHDDLYKAHLDFHYNEYTMNPATKEVLNYSQALQEGYKLVKDSGLLTNNTICSIQRVLEGNTAGFRKVPGTKLQDSNKVIIYTPPQDILDIDRLMKNLEQFINDDHISDLDNLVKMAVIHHQFESIHPFYDGNGRTGRILCVLFLVQKGLLDLPILYISRYITHNKSNYYRLLQAIRDSTDNEHAWREWVYFMLKGIEETASNTLSIIDGISLLMTEYKAILKPIFGRTYKHELLNNLFFNPYTKIEYMAHDMGVKRITATKYLNIIVEHGLLDKCKLGKSNYYVNTRLIDLFTNYHTASNTQINTIESVNLKA